MPLVCRDAAWIAATDANAADSRGLFMDRHISVGAGVILYFNNCRVLISLAQIRKKNICDQSPLVDQAAATVGGDTVMHGITCNVIRRRRLAARVFQHLGWGASDIRDAEPGG